MNTIILVSEGKKFVFDKKILSNISDFINSFDDVENEITTIPINNFNFNSNEVKIIQDYVLYLGNLNNYDYNKNNNTIKYYIYEFNNYHLNINIKIARDFVKKIGYPQTEKVFNLSKYMNINFLTEELFKFNMENFIKINCKCIDILEKNKSLIKNILAKTKEDYKDYIADSKIENIDEEDLNFSDEDCYEDDNDVEMEIDDEIDNLPNDIKNKISIDNQLLKSKKKILRDEYLDLIRIYKGKINYLNQKFEELSIEIYNKINDVSNKIKDYINNSQNLFFVSNANFCNKCFNIWYISELYNLLFDKNSECEYCNDELPDLEEVFWNLKSVLDDDIEDYNPVETEDMTIIQHIYENLIRDNDYLEDECLNCYLNRDLICCGENYDNFSYDIIRNCCKKYYCEEHFGDSSKICCENNCNNEVAICEECNKSNDLLNDEKCDSICKGCIEPYCNYHIYRRRCKDCGWKISDDY